MSYTNSVSFEAESIREYAKAMPGWFNPEWATWLQYDATNIELTMIGDGITGDDEFWETINRLIAKHTEDHLQARLAGIITDEDIKEGN